jgi:hypothetical protein
MAAAAETFIIITGTTRSVVAGNAGVVLELLFSVLSAVKEVEYCSIKPPAAVLDSEPQAILTILVNEPVTNLKYPLDVQT